jgi:hypothetical protein
MKQFFIPIIGLAFIALSCEKINTDHDNKTTESDVLGKTNISCENGILIFSDYENLIKYESSANLMDINELTKLEMGYGFESQKRIFESIAKKEYDLQITPFEGKTEEEMKNIPFPGHCTEYYEAIKMGIIMEIIEPEGSYIDYNLTDRSMAAYLNKDGLVIVGNVLYFVKGNTIKSLENATVSDGQKLISDANSNSSGIFYDKSILSGTYTAYRHDALNGDWVEVGNFRTKMSATWTIKTFGANSGTNWSSQMQLYPLSIGTNSQRKNGWGNWNQYWGPQTIYGPAKLQLDWSQNWYGPYSSNNGISSDFSTYYYMSSASNATVKYHPITGAPAATLDYLIITAPLSGFYGWGNYPIRFYINADLPGGCCGFTRHVEWEWVW